MHASYYAKALFGLSRDKNQSEQQDLVVRLLRVLKANGHIKLLPAILREYERIEYIQKKKRGAILSVVKLTHQEKLKRDINLYRNQLGLAEKKIEVKIDAHLIGGFTLQTESTMTDASYKKMLLELYRRMVAT